MACTEEANLKVIRSSRAKVFQAILAEEINDNPCCSGNREGLDGLAPIRMVAGIGKQQRYPHKQPKEHEHHCQKASGEKRHAIGKKSHGRERKENSGRYGPEHLTGRKPFGNKTGGRVKIKCLFEGKGSGTQAQKNAADVI